MMATLWKTVTTVYDDYMSSADPRVASWFLISSPIPLLVLVSIYVTFVKIIGPGWMANRKPYDLRQAMIVYNIVIIIGYIHFIKETFWALIASKKGLLCRIEEPYSPYGMKIAEMGWFCLILKLTEFADTVFFVLRKKFQQISTLHVVHHATVPFFLWSVLRVEPDGYNYFFPVINALVHIVMYSYYGLSALGPKYQKYLWWKKYLTTLQLVQFVIVYIYFGLMTLMGCKISKFSKSMHIFVAGLFFVLFCNFFRNTYIKKKTV